VCVFAVEVVVLALLSLNLSSAFDVALHGALE